MDTIFALSSGTGQAGVAVVRLSGERAYTILQKLTHLQKIQPRYATYATLWEGQQVLDKAIVLYFKAPHSFTGEDVVEIQCHGSRAVLNQLFSLLGKQARMAEAGEFTKRAVLNGKMDLTAAEGLLDLIHADTQKQREWAVRQMDGALKELYDSWRERIIKLNAMMTAYLDFPDEEIPQTILKKVHAQTVTLQKEIKKHLLTAAQGRKVHDGFSVVLIGATNVGKSSLLNALVGRDAAIVSHTAGTTRDVVEATVERSGYLVTFSDTAGLRATRGKIEQEGQRRALRKIEQADIILALADARRYPVLPAQIKKILFTHPNTIVVWNKGDLASVPIADLVVSAKRGTGLDALEKQLAARIEKQMGQTASLIVTRPRYEQALQVCEAALARAAQNHLVELQAEELRIAADALGRITGRVNVEELFNVIFSEFCIGK